MNILQVIFCWALVAISSFGCTYLNNESSIKVQQPSSAKTIKSIQTAKMLPKQGKVMLMIGQDLKSVQGYTESGKYPTPAGVTTYLSFYNLLSSEFPAFGALGEDSRGRPTGETVDWGAGPLNALISSRKFPNSALSIGLNIAEGNQSQMWAAGGLAEIARGKHDRVIRRLAAFIKSIDNPVFLRVGYEFDGVWNKGYERMNEYIDAYRRIVDVMRLQKVNNVAFVWQASTSPIDDIIEGKHEDISDWYPGDDYVDWIGLSWFLSPDKSPNGQVTQRKLANEVITLARKQKKPVMIAEAAPQGYDLLKRTVSYLSPVWNGKAGSNIVNKTDEEIWHEWYQPFFAYIRQNSDVIKAVAYINAEWSSQSLWSIPYSNGYWGDSRVQVNKGISRRWESEMNDSKFWAHGGPTY